MFFAAADPEDVARWVATDPRIHFLLTFRRLIQPSLFDCTAILTGDRSEFGDHLKLRIGATEWLDAVRSKTISESMNSPTYCGPKPDARLLASGPQLGLSLLQRIEWYSTTASVKTPPPVGSGPLPPGSVEIWTEREWRNHVDFKRLDATIIGYVRGLDVAEAKGVITDGR